MEEYLAHARIHTMEFQPGETLYMVGWDFREGGEVSERMPAEDDWESKVTWDELMTTVAEVEMIVNSRPEEREYLCN